MNAADQTPKILPALAKHGPGPESSRERKRLEQIRRRIAHLDARAQASLAKGGPRLFYDESEASALRWLVERHEQLRALEAGR